MWSAAQVRLLRAKIAAVLLSESTAVPSKATASIRSPTEDAMLKLGPHSPQSVCGLGAAYLV